LFLYPPPSENPPLSQKCRDITFISLYVAKLSAFVVLVLYLVFAGCQMNVFSFFFSHLASGFSAIGLQMRFLAETRGPPALSPSHINIENICSHESAKHTDLHMYIKRETIGWIRRENYGEHFSRYFVATQREILGVVYCWYRGRNR